MSARKIGQQESRLIGDIIGDVFVALGHPLTCNGGNPNLDTHHDHEVLMLRDDDGSLVCPECGRVQEITMSRAPSCKPLFPTPERISTCPVCDALFSVDQQAPDAEQQIHAIFDKLDRIHKLRAAYGRRRR